MSGAAAAMAHALSGAPIETKVPLIADRHRLLHVSVGRRFATQVSHSDIQDMAHFVAVAGEMLEDLRRVCVAVRDGNHVLTPESILKWLDEHQPQLIRATAQPVTEQETST